jgi:hypothetical protein
VITIGEGMMADNYELMLEELEEKIKTRVPGFEIRFKDKSKFMRFISKILFFNNKFMSRYITTIFDKVYWPNKKRFKQNPVGSFLTLAHEYVHIMDWKRHPILFVLGYLFPQVLSLPGIVFVLFSFIIIPLMLFSIVSPYWLFSLLTLIFLAPIPSYFRTKYELKGYSMSIKAREWLFGSADKRKIRRSADQFTGPAYYWMSRVDVYSDLKSINEVKLINGPNPAFKDVRDIIMQRQL